MTTDGRRQWVWSQNCGGRREIHRLYTLLLLRLSQPVTLTCFKASGPACIKLSEPLGIFITNQGTSGGTEDDIGTTRRCPGKKKMPQLEQQGASCRASYYIPAARHVYVGLRRKQGRAESAVRLNPAWAVHRPKHPIVILGGTRLLVVLQSGIARCNQLIT